MLIYHPRKQRCIGTWTWLLESYALDEAEPRSVAESGAIGPVRGIASGQDAETFAVLSTAEVGNLRAPMFVTHHAWDTLLPVSITPLPQFGFKVAQALAVSPDGSLLAVAGYRERLLLIDARSGSVLGENEAAHVGISGLSFSPDGQRLSVGLSDQGGGTLAVFDVSAQALAQARERQTVPTTEPRAPGPNSPFKVDPRSGLISGPLLAPLLGCVELSRAGLLEDEHGDLADATLATCFSHDGRWLATYECYGLTAKECENGTPQGALALYDTSTWQLKWAVQVQENLQALFEASETRNFAATIAFSARSDAVLVGSQAGKVLRYDSASGQALAPLQTGSERFVVALVSDATGAFAQAGSAIYRL